MNGHRVADQIPPPCRADSVATTSWARWVREEWQAVRVTQLETGPVPADGLGRVRVHVNVHLGALAPADVLVEATVDGSESTEPLGGWPIRLWSVQSLRNGTYVFEGLLPREAVEPSRPLSVRVRPGAPHEALSTLHEVARVFGGSNPARTLHDARRLRVEPTAVSG
jgi:hypothetical protein